MAKWKEDAMDYYEATKPQTVMDMVREFATVTEQIPDPDLYARLIEEEFEEWAGEYTIRKTRDGKGARWELKELADLLYVVYGYANAREWNLDEAVRRVHENNLGRCIQPDGTVKRREDGKILKNPDYPKVQLEDLI